MNVNEKSVDVFLFKAAKSTTSREPDNNGVKAYFSTTKNPLTKDGHAQASKLQEVINSKGPFTQIISGSNQASIETALLACGATVEGLQDLLKQVDLGTEDDPKETGQVVINERSIRIQRCWRQVEMGAFEGADNTFIQSAFLHFHPNHKGPAPEANDCLNHPWTDLPKWHAPQFEAYKTLFNARIRQSLADIFNQFASEQPGEARVAVFTQKEPVRSTMLEAEPSQEALKDTKFWQAAKDNGKSLEGAKNLEERAIRYNLNPKDGSWIKVRVFADRILLLEVCEDIKGQEAEFRK